MIELLKTLCNTNTVSGNEENLFPFLCEQLRSSGCETKTGQNVYGIRKGKSGLKIMLDAHIDKIGFMVTGFEPGGFLRFASIGGVDTRTLLSNEMIIHGKQEIYGVVATMAPHLLKKEDREKSPKIEKLYLDTGYEDETLRQIVSVGDTISYKPEFTKLANGFICSNGLDNSAGAAVIVDVMKKLSEKKLNNSLYAVLSAHEEVDLSGAAIAAEKLQPDVAVVVDVTHGTTPDSKGHVTFRLGSGAAIGVGPNMDRKLTQRLIRLAKEKNIPYDIETLGGSSGTNAICVQVAGRGVLTVLVSIPLRYMHTMSEVVCLSDMEKVSELITAFIEELEGGLPEC